MFLLLPFCRGSCWHGFAVAEAKGTDGFSGDFQTSKPPWCKIVLEAGTWSFAGPHRWNLPLQSFFLFCFSVVSSINWFASNFQHISQIFCASEMLAPWKLGPYFFLKPECSHRTCCIYLRVWIRTIYHYLPLSWILLVNLQVVPNLWSPWHPCHSHIFQRALARENCWKWLWRKRSTEPLDWWICRGGRWSNAVCEVVHQLAVVFPGRFTPPWTITLRGPFP